MKKTKLILFTLLFLLLLLVLVWFFFMRDPSRPVGDAFKDILPFGSGDFAELPLRDPIERPDDSFGVTDGRPTQALFRVAESPVAGFILLTQGTSTVVRYTDRATGHIHDAELSTLTRTRITNTTIPKIYEAHFRADGQAVLYRSLAANDAVENVLINLAPPRAGDPDQLYTPNATVLRGDVREVAVGAGNILYFVLRDSKAIVSSTFEGTNQRTILSTPFTDWRLAPFGNSLIVWTKASASARGYAYTLNTSTGALSKILGPLRSVTLATNSLGGEILYSYHNNNQTILMVRNFRNSREYEVLPATLAEKCVWSTKENLVLYCGVPKTSIGTNEPSNWYKGITRFSDNIWKFEIDIGYDTILAEPKKLLNVDLDVYQPAISPQGDYMVFINRNDLSLWALELN